jgi:hypothetical protein
MSKANCNGCRLFGVVTIKPLGHEGARLARCSACGCLWHRLDLNSHYWTRIDPKDVLAFEMRFPHVYCIGGAS